MRKFSGVLFYIDYMCSEQIFLIEFYLSHIILIISLKYGLITPPEKEHISVDHSSVENTYFCEYQVYVLDEYYTFFIYNF